MYKTKQMYGFLEGLSHLLEVDMNAIAAYKVQKNYHKVLEEYKIIDKVREDLVKQHGKSDKADDEFSKLLDEDVDVKLSKISLKDLDNLTVTPRTLALINDLLIESESEPDTE